MIKKYDIICILLHTVDYREKTMNNNERDYGKQGEVNRNNRRKTAFKVTKGQNDK